MRKIIVGSRCSRLALVQTGLVLKSLKTVFPEREFVIREIKTTGDLIQDIPLEKIGDKGLFIKELEIALLNKEIDLAVHSMKDLPTELPSSLMIGAILPRENPLDVLIGTAGLKKLTDCRSSTVIGSSSLRRKAQLLHHYPHLKIESIRGNLETRFLKLRQGQFQALVLAYAGVVRLGWNDQITELIPAEICLPAVGQGAMGIEMRSDDHEIAAMLATINCAVTKKAVSAERSFLSSLDGGCHVPIGALAEIRNDRLTLEGMVAAVDGSILIRESLTGSPEDAEQLGRELGKILLRRGCGSILKGLREGCEKK